MPQRLIVVKVGTNGITNSDGELDSQEMANLAEQIADGRQTG